MARQITNAKAINAKAKGCKVEHLGGDTYEVTSCTSGKVYQVTATDAGGFCTCDWSKYRPSDDRRSGCSHVQAVYQHIAATESRTTSAWSTTEQARRQHRPTLDIGDGVTLTTRKVPA